MPDPENPAADEDPVESHPVSDGEDESASAALRSIERRISSLGQLNWSDTLIGAQVGQYQVLEIISSGGMGTVYAAEQETPRRTVALKMLNRDITSISILERFEYESQILARLRHPAIAQVFESGRHSIGGAGALTLPWFAMEYVENARLITGFAR